jgi:hypothetical protein
VNGQLLSLEMIYDVINGLQVDLLKGPQRLGDLAFSIDFDQRLMLTRSALGVGYSSTSKSV